jgi:hypothetical protein
MVLSFERCWFADQVQIMRTEKDERKSSTDDWANDVLMHLAEQGLPIHRRKTTDKWTITRNIKM